MEKEGGGGMCFNRGCIPSKMRIHPADVAHEIREAHKFDIHNNPAFTVNFKNLITRISDTIDRDSASIATGYGQNPNIDYYKAQAKFVADKIVKVNGEQLTADRIFIAVGARPAIPHIPGLAGTPFMTSTEALRNTELPKKLIVLGAGYIAVELGYAYGALGTDVEFVVRSRFLRKEDSQIAEEFTRVFSNKFRSHVGCIPTKIEHVNDQFIMTIRNAQGHSLQLKADALLVATGIVSNADTLQLQNTQIQLDKNGFVQVDEHLQTKAKDVYALGDCIGRYFYRHTVNFEGEYLFDSIFAKTRCGPIQYPPIPHAIFTNPQIAGVGKTEDRLKQEGVNYVAGVNSYAKSAMGMALLSDHGFCKILIDRKTKKILGAHIIGDEASNMIHMLIAFMNKEATLDDLLNMIYIHPALPEIVRNAARKAKTVLDG